MGKNAPKINALIDLLSIHNRPALEELRRRYPHDSNMLSTGIVMGDAVGPQERQIYLDVTLEALQIAKQRVEPNIGKLRQRLEGAKRLRLAGQTVAAITSVGLISATLAQWDSSIATVTAVINFGAVLCALLASHLESPLHGGAGSLIDTFETLASTTADAEQAIQEIVILTRAGGTESRVLEQVSRANAIANKLRIAERMLWGSPAPQR
jgi:hypothetical protein